VIKNEIKISANQRIYNMICMNFYHIKSFRLFKFQWGYRHSIERLSREFIVSATKRRHRRPKIGRFSGFKHLVHLDPGLGGKD